MKKNNTHNTWDDIAGNPAIQKDTESYRQIWEASREIEFPDFDEEKALKQMQKKMLSTPAFAPWMKYAAMAATLAIFAVLAVIFFKNPGNNTMQFVEITVKKGEKLSINLPDGNKVWLNSNTTIKYPANFTGFNRRIEISGEAFFEFKNNNEFPIMIATKNVLINCEAGMFNVKCTGDQDKYATYITVEKGKVILNNAVLPEAITVESGYLASLSGELPLFIEENPSVNYDSWKTGQLTFRKVSLASVAEDLTEFYGIPVRIKGDIKYCEFTSEYKDADISLILNDMKKNLKASIIQHTNEIIITGNNCL